MKRDGFRGLHPEKRTDTQHIRLISEGGRSPAWKPGPVCIDSIHFTQTCTTESHHTGYRAATGACTMFSTPDTSLFSVPASHARELDQKKIPPVLRTRFRQQGLPLTDQAVLTPKEQGRIWTISDAEGTYSVRKAAGRLTVYRELIIEDGGEAGPSA